MPMLRPIHAARAVLFGAILATAAGAQGAEPGAYATAVFGLANQSDQTLTFAGAGPIQTTEAALDRGGLAGGALGWQFDNGWRIEGEFAYQSVDSAITGFTAPAASGDGNYASTSVALNAIYAFDLFGSPRTTTYIGAGLVRLTEIDLDVDTPAGERSYSGSGNGFQVLFGARYDLGERWYLDAGLRWLRASSVELDGEDGAPGRIEADYEPWALTVGIGWRF
ncbi:MAG: outer membrane beta-barrel protein [Xanthomonadaceae bacterium]|nr:outer membrane beta-barrel protein [Xanthomonadaceae bacterium]